MFVTSHCTKKFRQHVKLHDKEPSKQRLLNSNKLSRNADTRKTSNNTLLFFTTSTFDVRLGFDKLINAKTLTYIYEEDMTFQFLCKISFT